MDINMLSIYRDAVFHITSEETLVEKTIEVITGNTRYDAYIDILQENGSAGGFVGKILKNAAGDAGIKALLSNQTVTVTDDRVLCDLFQGVVDYSAASTLLIPLLAPNDLEKPTFMGVLSILSSDNSRFEPETVKIFQELAGHLAYAVAIIRRQSVLKAGMEELKNQRDMYHSVFENTGTGTIIIDNDMLILFANERFTQLTGYSRNEIEKTMYWSQFVIPEDRKKMQDYHYGRRKGLAHIPNEYECSIFDKTGQIRHIYMKVGMMPGTKISIASFKDISLRKAAEIRLSKSEYLLKSIVSSFDGFIYTLTQDYRLGFMNNPLINRTGYNAENDNCYAVIHGLDAPCPGCELERVFAGNVVKREEKSPRDNRWYSVTQSPIYNRISRITGVQVVMVDITERKQREDKIKESANYYQSENSILRSAMRERSRFGDIIGKSNGMQKVYELILRAAASNAHVILYGESGTGKELVATAIHKLSSRSKHAFVPVNCAAINDNLIESEFFGYKKGAFTGAERDKAGFLDVADKGTLFLDEIGDLGLNLQVKLLRSIEGGGFTPVGGNELKKPDLRIVAATNKDLKALIVQGLMREDFFYRVNIIPIRLPALRERKADIPLLIEHFLSRYEKDISIPPMDKKVLDAFLTYDWPGNVRELQHSLDRYVTLNECNFLESLVFPSEKSYEVNGKDMPMDKEKKSLPDMVADIEKQIIFKALENNRWMKSQTALDLGIHRKTLFTKMKKYEMETEEKGALHG